MYLGAGLEGGLPRDGEGEEVGGVPSAEGEALKLKLGNGPGLPEEQLPDLALILAAEVYPADVRKAVLTTIEERVREEILDRSGMVGHAPHKRDGMILAYKCSDPQWQREAGRKRQDEETCTA